eukprot:NODE_644_length_5619_cov_0.132790.p4 type:complete len:192 gc:universal NODE_644_length_5619_cov_0.132790:4830-5405(+)
MLEHPTSSTLFHLHFSALSNMFNHASQSNPAIGLAIGAINIEDTIQSNFPMDYSLLGQFIKLKGKNVLGWYGYKVPAEHQYKIHKQLESTAKKSLVFVDVEKLCVYRVKVKDTLILEPLEYKVLTGNNELVNMVKLAALHGNSWSNAKDVGHRQLSDMINYLTVIEKSLSAVDKLTYHRIYKLICQMVNSQ